MAFNIARMFARIFSKLRIVKVLIRVIRFLIFFALFPLALVFFLMKRVPLTRSNLLFYIKSYFKS
ncbi:MAG: hypothetical protein ACREC8_12520 [Limisphaerales bacterium]